MNWFIKVLDKIFPATYDGPTVEEIKRDMEPIPDYNPDPSLIEFGKVIASISNRKN